MFKPLPAGKRKISKFQLKSRQDNIVLDLQINFKDLRTSNTTTTKPSILNTWGMLLENFKSCSKISADTKYKMPTANSQISPFW